MASAIPDTTNPEIFRAYDIRGVVNETLHEQEAFFIGCAFAALLEQNKLSKKVIVGRDKRLSSNKLHELLIKGLLASGCDITDIGEVPTPVLYHAIHALSCPNGIMITASHNPAEYNGFKFVMNGRSLASEFIQSLYHIISKRNFINGQGNCTEKNITPHYCETIKNQIHLPRPLKIVVDCANAVAGDIVPGLFRELGCEVIPLYCDPDGRFPHHEPDPSVMENLADLCNAVKSHQADLGLAFDGDADRLFIVDDQGKPVFADYLILLFSQGLLASRPCTIVHDIKCSSLIHQFVEAHHGKVIMSRSGHTFLKETLFLEEADFGGEASGHFMFKDRWTGFDDGIYSAARLLEMISASSQAVSMRLAEFPNTYVTPEYKISMAEQQKPLFMQQFTALMKSSCKATFIELDGLRVEFPYGWGLLRASNTTPCLTARFEAASEAQLKEIADLFKAIVLQTDNSLKLPF